MRLDRRHFLLATLGGATLAARKSWAGPLLDKGFAQVTRMADGVYVTIADPAKGPQCVSNGGVIAGRDAALIVEGHFQPAGAALEIEAADRDVVFTGDLLFNQSYPVCIDADMVAWREVLDMFANYGRKTRFVPGHGAVCGLETVRLQADVMDDLRSHAEKMIGGGADAEEATRRYRPPKRFEAYELFSWDFTIGAALRSYYRTLRA